MMAGSAGLQSVAFPCLSTGACGYPRDEACQIAVSEVAARLEARPLPARVVFCGFTEEDERRYVRPLPADPGISSARLRA